MPNSLLLSAVAKKGVNSDAETGKGNNDNSDRGDGGNNNNSNSNSNNNNNNSGRQLRNEKDYKMIKVYYTVHKELGELRRGGERYGDVIAKCIEAYKQLHKDELDKDKKLRRFLSK